MFIFLCIFVFPSFVYDLFEKKLYMWFFLWMHIPGSWFNRQWCTPAKWITHKPMNNSRFKKILRSRQSTYCPELIAQETGSERLGDVPKDPLTSRRQSWALAPTWWFQVLCPFSCTISVMSPSLNMTLRYTSRKFFR